MTTITPQQHRYRQCFECEPYPIDTSRVIVTRHPAAVRFLQDERSAFSDVPILASATVADVRGRQVIGNVPFALAAEADSVLAIEFTGSAPRGAEYTAAEMRAAGAHLVEYCVVRADSC